MVKKLKLNYGIQVSFLFYFKNKAGSERYRGIVRSHFTYVTGVVLVFDLTNK